MAHAIRDCVTRRVSVFWGIDFRECNETVPPMNDEGKLVCPRCGSGEKDQIDCGLSVQYSFFSDGDRYSYYQRCSSCELNYVWFDRMGG